MIVSQNHYLIKIFDIHPLIGKSTTLQPLTHKMKIEGKKTCHPSKFIYIWCILVMLSQIWFFTRRTVLFEHAWSPWLAWPRPFACNAPGTLCIWRSNDRYFVYIREQCQVLCVPAGAMPGTLCTCRSNARYFVHMQEQCQVLCVPAGAMTNRAQWEQLTFLGVQST